MYGEARWGRICVFGRGTVELDTLWGAWLCIVDDVLVKFFAQRTGVYLCVLSSGARAREHENAGCGKGGGQCLPRLWRRRLTCSTTCSTRCTSAGEAERTVIKSIASSWAWGFEIKKAGKTRKTYREETLCVLAVVLDGALLVDRHLVRLVAHCVHLCDAVNACLWCGTWGRGWWCFGRRGRREDDWVGGSVVRCGHVVDGEQCGEQGDLQALAVRNVESTPRFNSVL
jgi:hypothetical protein